MKAPKTGTGARLEKISESQHSTRRFLRFARNDMVIDTIRTKLTAVIHRRPCHCEPVRAWQSPDTQER